MALTVSSPRRLRALAAAAGAALVLPLLAAAPATAQTTTTSTSAATSAAALRLVLNLPEENTLQIDVDPVTGTIRSVTGSGPEARAYAAVIAGGLGEEGQAFGEAIAMLPEPLEASGGPLDQLNDGINDSELGDFLLVEALGSEASVTTAPNSASEAGTRLGVGLPPPLAEGLLEVLEQVIDGIDTLLVELAPIDEATGAVCEGLSEILNPVGEGAGALPVVGPSIGKIINDADEGLNAEDTGTLCELREFLILVLGELDDGLGDLGEVGLLTVGLLEASQSITTEGRRVTATASASVADIDVLGIGNPFVDADVLETTSTAVLAPGVAEATIDAAAVEVDAEPVALIGTDLSEELEGQLLGIELDGVEELVTQIRALLDALAGIGIEGGRLTAPDDTLEACPEAIDLNLSGTFEAPGVCAAAAALGYGLRVNLPEELAEPLGLAGPLLAVQFVPTAAIVRSETTTTAAPPRAAPAPAGPLPRTGAETLLAGAGIALIMGAALVRRRRLPAEL
jgi:hypothetical protein